MENKRVLTVIETIREFCRACVGSKEEVKSCTGNKAFLGPCPLYSYRTGTVRKNMAPKYRVFQAVLKTYSQCQGGSSKAVVDCDTKDCALHDLRLGDAR